MLTLVGAVAAHGAEVYRSTDANGVVVYSDRPQSEDAKPIFVAAIPRSRSQSSAPAAAAKPSATAAQTEPANKDDPNRGIRGETQTPQQEAEVKAKNCEIAKQRQATYTQAHRLYKSTADGGREYL